MLLLLIFSCKLKTISYTMFYVGTAVNEVWTTIFYLIFSTSWQLGQYWSKLDLKLSSNILFVYYPKMKNWTDLLNIMKICFTLFYTHNLFHYLNTLSLTYFHLILGLYLAHAWALFFIDDNKYLIIVLYCMLVFFANLRIFIWFQRKKTL